MPEFQLCATWRWLNRARWMGKNHISVTILHQRCKKILLFRRTSILFKSCLQIWVKCVSIKIRYVFWILIQFSDYLFPLAFMTAHSYCATCSVTFINIIFSCLQAFWKKAGKMNFHKNGQLIYGIVSKPLKWPRKWKVRFFLEMLKKGLINRGLFYKIDSKTANIIIARLEV